MQQCDYEVYCLLGCCVTPQRHSNVKISALRTADLTVIKLYNFSVLFLLTFSVM
jgi:hypothetical protein